MSDMTAKRAISFLQGERALLKAQLVAAGRSGLMPDTTKLEDALAAFEYAEATLVAQRSTGKSGLKAGVAAGFVPYADR